LTNAFLLNPEPRTLNPLAQYGNLDRSSIDRGANHSLPADRPPQRDARLLVLDYEVIAARRTVERAAKLAAAGDIDHELRFAGATDGGDRRQSGNRQTTR
jgi:hypothetical protein